MRVNVSERLCENKVDPCPTSSNSTRECSDCLDLDQVGPATARRIILLALPTICFSCKLFAKFCKKMLEWIARRPM